MIGALQGRIKQSSSNLVTFALRVFSGSVIGLTLALIGEVIFEFQLFSFALIITVFTLGFLKMSKGWTWVRVLVFDLICVLVALLLRMYILIAPGA